MAMRYIKRIGGKAIANPTNPAIISMIPILKPYAQLITMSMV
jgi:hypothetical protein